MAPDDVFFDLWVKSYREGAEPLWVEPSPPNLGMHCRLADKGLLVSGCVNGQDDYVWRLTPKGALVGAALDLDVLETDMKAVPTTPAYEGITDFDAILVNFGPKRLRVIKLVRGLLGLSINEAKKLVDKAPSILTTGVSWEDSQATKSQFEEEGATIQVRPTR